MASLANLLDMDFKFVLPSIYINFDTETNFEVNQTQISHSISKNTPKNHQSGHISKPHCAQVSFAKKPTSPTFFNEFVWNVQNQCKYGFCTYESWQSFDLGLQNNFSQNLAKMAINWHKIGQMPLWHKKIKLGITWSFFVQFWHYFCSKCLFFKDKSNGDND